MRKETRIKINQVKSDLMSHWKLLFIREGKTIKGNSWYKPSVYIRQVKGCYSANIVMKAIDELIEEGYMNKSRSNKRFDYQFISE